ncbi:MAG: hypothetical protein P8104_08125 [Gammaproteobacteria bacterium]
MSSVINLGISVLIEDFEILSVPRPCLFSLLFSFREGAFAWAVFDDELVFCVLLVLPLFIIQGIFSPVVLNVVAGSVRDTCFHFDAFSEFIVSS